MNSMAVVMMAVDSPLPVVFSPPLTKNYDGHLDFKEMVCGISAACRGLLGDRSKCKLCTLAFPFSQVIYFFLSAQNYVLYPFVFSLFQNILF